MTDSTADRQPGPALSPDAIAALKDYFNLWLECGEIWDTHELDGIQEDEIWDTLY